MSAHTFAPWYVISEGLQEAAIGYRAIIDADGYTVCNPSPMGEANARLIAAAPELLEALQRVEALAEYAKDNPRRQTDKLFDILETVRAVIAKATGEAA